MRGLPFAVDQLLGDCRVRAASADSVFQLVFSGVLAPACPDRFEQSHSIDVIVYYRQYTPLVFNQNGTMYIPAESVYPVLEANQDLTRASIICAGKKAASVRRLRRSVGRIVDAWGGVKDRNPPFDIAAGIVT
jgi:hypothetical protein